jgi:hypothetical protein
MADNAIDLNVIAAAAAARKAKGAGPQEDAAAGFGRGLALGGRSVAQGVGGLVGMFSDPIAAVQNALIGPQGAIYPVFEEGVQPLRDQVSNILTEFGVPEPLTVTERIIGAITEGAAGAGGQVALARVLLVPLPAQAGLLRSLWPHSPALNLLLVDLLVAQHRPLLNLGLDRSELPRRLWLAVWLVAVLHRQKLDLQMRLFLLQFERQSSLAFAS